LYKKSESMMNVIANLEVLKHDQERMKKERVPTLIKASQDVGELGTKAIEVTNSTLMKATHDVGELGTKAIEVMKSTHDVGELGTKAMEATNSTLMKIKATRDVISFSNFKFVPRRRSSSNLESVPEVDSDTNNSKVSSASTDESAVGKVSESVVESDTVIKDAKRMLSDDSSSFSLIRDVMEAANESRLYKVSEDAAVSDAGFEDNSLHGLRQNSKESIQLVLDKVKSEHESRKEKLMSDAERIRRHYKEQALNFNDVFFGYRQLFIRTVDTTVMLNCIWLAFWATNYMLLATESHNADIWVTLIVCSVVFLIPVVGSGLECIFKLVAITKFDVDSFAKLVEMNQEIDRLLLELREKLTPLIGDLIKLSGGDKDKVQIINDLFHEIDVSGDGEICKNEFRELLTKIGLRFSVRKMNKLFYAIDRDKQGTISLEEFKEVIFDDDSINQSTHNKDHHTVSHAQLESDIHVLKSKNEELEIRNHILATQRDSQEKRIQQLTALLEAYGRHADDNDKGIVRVI